MDYYPLFLRRGIGRRHLGRYEVRFEPTRLTARLDLRNWGGRCSMTHRYSPPFKQLKPIQTSITLCRSRCTQYQAALGLQPYTTFQKTLRTYLVHEILTLSGERERAVDSRIPLLPHRELDMAFKGSHPTLKKKLSDSPVPETRVSTRYLHLDFPAAQAAIPLFAFPECTCSQQKLKPHGFILCQILAVSVLDFLDKAQPNCRLTCCQHKKSGSFKACLLLFSFELLQNFSSVSRPRVGERDTRNTHSSRQPH